MSGRAVILDLDGTLVDSARDIAAAGNHARRQLGLPELPLAAIVAYVGDGAGKLVERLTPDADQAARERALAAFQDHYGRHCTEHTRPYPGIPALLAALRAAGWRLGVATNKPAAFTAAILEACGLAAAIDGVRGGDRSRKPEPGQLLELFDELRADAAASWMVGDHHTDIRAARAAGCRVLWCAWGFGHRDSLAVDAEAGHPLQVAERLA